MLNFEFGQNRYIRKKKLVIATHTGFEWIFQTCPIDLKFCMLVANVNWMLNCKFGQNPVIRKKVLVMVTHTGFKWNFQTRPINLKFEIFWKHTFILINFHFLHSECSRFGSFWASEASRLGRKIRKYYPMPKVKINHDFQVWMGFLVCCI